MHNVKNQFGGGCAGGWVGKEKEGGQREGVTVKERERDHCSEAAVIMTAEVAIALLRYDIKLSGWQWFREDANLQFCLEVRIINPFQLKLSCQSHYGLLRRSLSEFSFQILRGDFEF